MSIIRPISTLESFDAGVNIARKKTLVALPGTIRSFDPETVTCVVDMAMMAEVVIIPEQSTSIDRLDRDTEDLPFLMDAPVIFPRGGGCTMTFPISPGDECLVVFSQKNIDFWWQNGGAQSNLSKRLHDFSDAFVIPGPQSQAKKISNISATAAQLRTDDGAAFVEVAAGHDITIKTPGNLTASADGVTQITSPEIVLNGNVTINGNLSQGMGKSGGTASMNGPVTVKNDVTAGGKSLTGHTHSGVQTGSGHTGAPD